MGNSLSIIRDEGHSLAEDHRWLRTTHGWNDARSITLDGTAFLAVFEDGIVPSGVVLSYNAGTDRYVPYGQDITDESQTLTIDATGGTFTLSFDGETTGDIPFDATAGLVEMELESLPNIGDGNVRVTGDAGGPYTIAFIGELANADQPAITASGANLTGGAGTATVTAGVEGGAAEAAGTAVGLLMTTTSVLRGRQEQVVAQDVTAALFWHGEVIEDNLPANSGIDAGAIADLIHISFV